MATPEPSFATLPPKTRIALILDSGASDSMGADGKSRDANRGQKMDVLRSIITFLAGLFARKDDNFKSLLLSDLGIER